MVRTGAGHSLRGSVDWNICRADFETEVECHSLRGSVDWNIMLDILKSWIQVTPYAGVWIEIVKQETKDTIEKRHSLRGSVDWNLYAQWLYKPSPVTPYAGVWIEIQRAQVWRIKKDVTPYAGVWIEISIKMSADPTNKSLPTRECGLKSQMFRDFSTILTSLPTRECGLK